MLDLSRVTSVHFSKLEGQEFALTSLDPALNLKVLEVRKLGSGEREGGAFSILWQGPSEPALPQATYSLSHPEIGEHAYFLVPVTATEVGVQYEAVFT